MATARRKPSEPPGEPPAAQELDDALTDFAITAGRLEVARKEHDAARVRLVDMLRRRGLTGLVL
jgi:hypothetical protein